MAKKKSSWLSKLKRFFTSDTNLKSEKDKKRRWLFQRLKINRLASLAPPPPRLLSPLHETAQDETEDEQRKHDFTVAIAMAAAAEAAVAAAHAAAEAVRITTSAPQSVHKCEDDTQESPAIIQLDALQSIHEYEREHQELAAIKIQTAYRAHLARKALRALKGLVKLQAIIRGRAVRRQAMATLKCLQSIVSIQSQVCARRSQTLEETCECHDSNQWQELKDKVLKIESTDQRRWDDSILTKEEANALFLSKREALLKRERIKEYALSNRKSTDQEQNKANGNLRYWLEQWVDTQLAKREDLEDINSVLSSNPRTQDYGRRQLNYSTNCDKQYRLEGLVSPISVSRRSFHQKKQCPHGDDDKNSIPSSPGIVPTYMAATQSAKAKARSMSSPKLRPVSFDTYSEGNSPYKNKLSVISSVTSEVTSSGRIGKLDGFHYRSPSLKGIPGPVKSSRTLKDLSFDSECSLLNWDRYSSFK